MTNGPLKPIWIYMIAHYINQEDKTFCICLKTAWSKRAYVPICTRVYKYVKYTYSNYRFSLSSKNRSFNLKPQF